jgi:beta-glucosidase
VQVTYANSNSIDAAVSAAKAADVAIVFVATTSSEGSDRGSLSLPGNSDDLVKAVAGAQANTVVVIHTPGSVLMPWAQAVPAIVCAFLPGQEDGTAIANVLFGTVNPSARLPVTFSATASDIPVNTPQQYPGVNKEGSYSEKLLVGYRWYDARNVNPLFPFGHGLSYTTFDYSNLKISGMASSGISVSVDVKNSGKVAGAEVVQLYIGYPAAAGEPPKVLRGFDKVNIPAGQTQTVKFTLTTQDISIWHIEKHDWEVVSGSFSVDVGSSSRDIRAKGTFTN